MAAVPYSTNYSDDFDGNWYIDMYYSKVAGCEEEGDFLVFMIRSLHEIFSTGDINGKSLLDIGTGPVIHSVISACPYVEEIYLSDYADSNRQILRDWCEGKRELGIEICKFILGLENISNQTTEDRFTAIRQKVKNILPVDVLKQPPLTVDKTQFNIITSSLCFEAACQSVEHYNKIVKNVSSLLAPGGHLIIVGVLEETFYKVAEFRFPTVKISQADLQDAYTKNGFEIKTWKELGQLSPRDAAELEFSDFQKAFVMHAVKQ